MSYGKNYKKTVTTPKLLNQIHQKGNLSEAIALMWLVKKGNLVFKTIHDTGCVDIVTLDENGVIHLYDVKTVCIRQSGKLKGKKINRPLSQLQRKLGVEILNVNLKTEECYVTKHET